MRKKKFVRHFLAMNFKFFCFLINNNRYLPRNTTEVNTLFFRSISILEFLLFDQRDIRILSGS